MAEPTDSGARRLDPIAVQAALRRLHRAAQPPWLHGEVARRMAEKLQLILRQPDLVLDWWSSQGAADALRAQARRPWWSALRRSAGAVEVVAEADDIAPGAG